jgi:hypothetical protein
MAWTLIRDVMRLLSPDRPIVQLARLGGCPRPTAKSWATGHRRPSVGILKAALEAIRERQTGRADVAKLEERQTISGLAYELEDMIRKRSYETRHLTGFNAVRERDGPGSVPRDARNRLGRPRRQWEARPGRLER